MEFLLHTKALLSTINYLNAVIPEELIANEEREIKRAANTTAAGKTGTHKHILFPMTQLPKLSSLSNHIRIF